MKKEYYLILPCLSVMLFLFIKSFSYNQEFHFRIRDNFTDTTDQKEMVFMFIEVNSYDSLEIWNNASNILAGHDLCRGKTNQILVSHYYHKDDIEEMPIHIQKGLKRRFPLKLGIENKFEYYPNGYIFTGTNSASRLKLKDKIIKRKSLLRVPVTKPKPQFKAKDILKK